MPEINAEITNNFPERIAQESRAMSNQGAVTLEVADDGPAPNYVVYIYNVLDKQHIVEQPPLFPHLVIPACPAGKKVEYTTIPAFVRERHEKTGTTENYTRKVDGRRCATSLLNPAAFPGTEWKSQLQSWRSTDQFGNNLNAWGVFWSLTKPDDPNLDAEVKVFREIASKTFEGLIKQAEALAASGKAAEITPNMHYAMDKLGKQAPWHMATRHMTICPNCGDTIPEGLSYHRNAFGEKCIIDRDRYEASIERTQAAEVEASTESAPKTRTSKKMRTT